MGGMSVLTDYVATPLTTAVTASTSGTWTPRSAPLDDNRPLFREDRNGVGNPRVKSSAAWGPGRGLGAAVPLGGWRLITDPISLEEHYKNERQVRRSRTRAQRDWQLLRLGGRRGVPELRPGGPDAKGPPGELHAPRS